MTSTANLNWPSLSTGESFFDRALANGNLEGGEDHYANDDAAAASRSAALDSWAKDEETHDEIDPEAGGWELDAGGEEAQATASDEVEEVAEEADLGAGATPGVPETELWARNSPFAADHVAAGSFESAMQVCVSLILWMLPNPN